MENISELFDLFGENIFCSICQEDCSEGQRIRAFYECKHSFHLKCIDIWLKGNKSCPTCRHNYNIPEKKELSYENVNDIERLYLTWTVLYGVLKRFKNARSFNDTKDELFNLLPNIRFENYRLLPLELNGRSSLNFMKQYISNRIFSLTSISRTAIHRQPNVYRWIDKIEAHQELSRFIRY